MTKKLWFPSLLFVAVIVCLLCWKVTWRQEDHTSPPLARHVAVDAEPEKEQLTLDAPLVPTLHEAEKDEPTRASANAEEVELEGALWVEGRVIFPPGTPSDESAEVIARGRSFKTLGHHRASIEADGSFRVAFSPRTRIGRLVVEGRYIYLAPSYRVDFRKDVDKIVLEPELGGLLSVTVHLPEDVKNGEVSPAGIPLHVWSVAGTQRNALAVQRGDQFTCDVPRLPPGVEYEVSLEGSSWMGEKPIDIHVPPGVHTHVELSPPGIRLRGRVVDTDGQPVADAELTIESSHVIGTSSSGHTSTGPRTDEDGTFVIRWGQPGTIQLSAEREGYIPAKTALGRLVEGEHRDDIELVLSRGLRIAGRVIWPDGTGARGAKLRFDWARSGNWSASSSDYIRTVDPDGNFVKSGLANYEYKVTASAVRPAPRSGPETLVEKRAREKERWLVSALVQGGVEDLVLELGTGATLAGTVVDDTGAPVDSGEVRAKGSGPFMTESTPIEPTGGFALTGLAAGEWELWAGSAEHAPTSRVRVSVPRDSEPIQLRVQRRVRITGRVVDRNGVPISEAKVVANVSVDGRSGPAWSHTTTATSEGGTFELDPIAPGRIAVSASKSGFARGEKHLELAPGIDGHDVELILLSGGLIEGAISPRPGIPLAHRKVELQGETYEKAWTDEAGRFAFEHLPSGTYDVLHEHVRGIDKVRVEVLEGETTRVELGRREPGNVRIHGTVTRGGVGVAGLFVSIEMEDDQLMSFTDDAGAYELFVQPGEYSVSVSESLTEGGCGQSHRVEAGQATELRLDFVLGQANLSGKVLGPQGNPLGGIYLSIQATDTATDSAGGGVISDSKGNFQLRGLLPGTYRLWAEFFEDEPYSSPTLELELAPGQELKDVELTLSPSGRIEGVLTTATGAPLVGAEMMLLYEDMERRLYTNSDGAGRYRIHVPPGRWTVRGQKGLHASAWSEWVTVTKAHMAEVDLVTTPGTVVQVVLDGIMEPVRATLDDGRGGHYHSLYAAGDPKLAELGGPPRGWRVGPVPPGTYEVVVTLWSSQDKTEAIGTIAVSSEPFVELVLKQE